MRVHLSRRGLWVMCAASQRSCPRLIHLDGVPVEVATGLPPVFLEQLVESLNPPTEIDYRGAKLWHDAAGRLHREHGLPAMVAPSGARCWYQHGVRHRWHDRPAVVRADGTQEWWWHGRRHREGYHNPAIIHADGRREYYVDNIIDRVRTLHAKQGLL